MQHDHQAGEEPLGDELEERQLEDVEADVLVELRVLDAEALAGCVKSTHCFHCDETPMPAISAKNSDTPMRIRPVYGPATCW